jgi:uncharacterized protein (DUF2342 family)
MGIDGIGKKGPPAPPPPKEAGGPSRPTEAGRAFEVSRPVPPGHAEQVRAGAIEAPRTALDRLRAGEIDVNGYVDLKVDEATAHLGKLPPVELEAIRSTLRDRLGTDPTLTDLVRTATGHAPQPPQDE